MAECKLMDILNKKLKKKNFLLMLLFSYLPIVIKQTYKLNLNFIYLIDFM